MSKMTISLERETLEKLVELLTFETRKVDSLQRENYLLFTTNAALKKLCEEYQVPKDKVDQIIEKEIPF